MTFGCLLPMVGAGLLLLGWAVTLTTSGRWSAVVVYGVSIFLFWWAYFLSRRRRQILHESTADLTFVDLDSGGVSKATGDDMRSALAVALRPMLETALRTGKVVPLPADCPRETALEAMQDGDLLVFRILSAIDYETPLASVTAARSEPVSQRVWWRLDAMGAADLPARPAAPWCALYLPIVVIGGADPDDRSLAGHPGPTNHLVLVQALPGATQLPHTTGGTAHMTRTDWPTCCRTEFARRRRQRCPMWWWPICTCWACRSTDSTRN